MQAFEYKAIPAPVRGTKAKGVKTTEDRFALSMTEAMNEMAEDGWDHVRAETLPCEERKGLRGTQTSFQNVLIFRRRVRADVATSPAPLTLEPAPQPARREPSVSRPPAEAADPG